MPAIIEHQKSTVTEARSVLIGAGGTFVVVAAIFGVVDWFYTRSNWPENKSFVVGFITMQAVIFSIFFYFLIRYVTSNFQANSLFLCRIDEDQICCFSPVELCGESFTIPIGNIAKIEQEIRKNARFKSSRWYIWDTAGRKFWLTSNYNNPVDKFIDAIRERCPDVIEIQS